MASILASDFKSLNIYGRHRIPAAQQLIYEIVIGHRFLTGPLSEKVKSVEVLSVLRHDTNEISVICRVEFKDLLSMPLEIFTGRKGDTQPLEQEKRGIYTFFVRRKLPKPHMGLGPDPYSFPLDGKSRVVSAR